MHESIGRLGKPPGQAPINYTKHLDKSFGFKIQVEKQYDMEVAGLRKNDASRSKWIIPVRPGHEMLNDEFKGNLDHFTSHLNDAKANDGLASVLLQHTILTLW